jgi:hypothetical protein
MLLRFLKFNGGNQVTGLPPFYYVEEGGDIFYSQRTYGKEDRFDEKSFEIEMVFILLSSYPHSHGIARPDMWALRSANPATRESMRRGRIPCTTNPSKY